MNKVVMILTNLFRPDVRVLKEAKYLVEHGFEVEILCWDRSNELINNPVEFIDKIKIIRFYPKSVPGTGLKQIKSYIMFNMQCKKYLKNIKFDFIHCHDLDGAIIGLFVKKRNSKFIFDMHEYYVGKTKKFFKKNFVKNIVKYIINKSDYVIYVNEIQKNDIDLNNKSKMVYLPNYPIIEDLNKIEKNISNKLRISYIGVVRQFNELKNLMDACKDFNDVHIFIHGSGVHYENIKQIEKNYTNVTVTGPYHYSESSILYRDIDISYIVYPMDNIQNIFGEPVKFFEAITSDTPMIVSQEMIIADYVTKRQIGFTVNGNNVEDIKTLIGNILNENEILEEKRANIKKIKSCFDWKTVVRNMDLIYKSDSLTP